MLALREGRTPPTELPAAAPARPAAIARSGSSSSSVGSGGNSTPADTAGGPPGESYYDREMRLRREAEERLRAKFGAGGLKGQSVSNSGGMGYTPPEPQAPE